MTHAESLIACAYSAFNRRDIDEVLALMTDTVTWPRASEGGRAIGKEEIRAYWTRQWQEFDPHVDPVEIQEYDAGCVRVRVRQIVKSLTGEVLSHSEVRHVYAIENGLIDRMDLGETAAPSEAFSRH